MHRTLVKCCGLRSEADIAMVNEYGADFAGFIMSRRFWRYVPPEKAAELKSHLVPGITAVGVFVDEPVDYVAGQLTGGTVDMVQLHGSEDDDYILELRKLVRAGRGVTSGPVTDVNANINPPGGSGTALSPSDQFKGRIIKAFRISSAADIERAVSSPADYILLDSGTGTGVAFDWSLMSSIPRPYFFAGGLGPDNVAEAIERFHPFAVDVSSGIETDKRKDPAKVAAFIKNARRQSPDPASLHP